MSKLDEIIRRRDRLVTNNQNLTATEVQLLQDITDLEKEEGTLRRELAKEREINRRACLDWAEDHSHLQRLCREVGCTEKEVEGDSYGVPGIRELADLLRRKSQNKKDEL